MVAKHRSSNVSNTNSNFIPIKCNVCQKVISSIGILKEHINTHKDEGLNSCSTEPKQSIENKTSNSDIIFKCQICCKEFNDCKDLKACWLSKNCEKNYKCVACFEKDGKSSLKDKITISSKTESNACEICGKTFKEKSKVKVHMKIHTGELDYMCNKCGKSYHTLDELQGHQRKHTGERPFACTLCGSNFVRKINLHAHMLNVHAEKTYKCAFCDYASVTDYHIKEHERIHTGELPFSCKICGERFRINGWLNRHMRIHTGVRNYKCHICNRKFSGNGGLNSHNKRFHPNGPPPHKCPHCDRTFIFRYDLKNHILMHTGNKPFKCDLCDASFVKKYQIKKHVDGVHKKIKKYGCRYCDKKFFYSSNVTIHERSHTGEKPFSCSICEKSFASKMILNVHLETHAGKSHECTICHKTYTRKIVLKKHIKRIHEMGPIPLVPKKRYSCQICGKSFTNPNIKKNHDRIHSVYKCQICGKDYRGVRGIRSHMAAAHSDVRPHKCKICNKTFSWKSIYKKHLRSHQDFIFRCDKCGSSIKNAKKIQWHKDKKCKRATGQTRTTKAKDKAAEDESNSKSEQTEEEVSNTSIVNLNRKKEANSAN